MLAVFTALASLRPPFALTFFAAISPQPCNPVAPARTCHLDSVLTLLEVLALVLAAALLVLVAVVVRLHRRKRTQPLPSRR